MLDPNVTPSISAGCAKCGFVYPLLFEFDCPRCHGTTISFATLAEYLPCDTLDAGEQAEIDWLENLGRLTDVRDSDTLPDAPPVLRSNQEVN